MTKESKCKGKAWLPAYVKRNPKVRALFFEPKRSRTKFKREPIVTKADYIRALQRTEAMSQQIENQRQAALEASFQQHKEKLL